tara:strand:- start:4665 stop:5570 length:906 start_codon:yes stop_codon:yes gene_type:complete
MLKNLIAAKHFTHEEDQYLELIKDILKEGSMETGRNGNVLTVYGSAMRFSLEHSKIPLLTTKRVAWKTCLKELLWFIQGKTDNKLLQEQNVKIWDGNSSKEYLESVGLPYEENDLGPVYGHQWRHFNAPYETCHSNYDNKGIDQLQYVIDLLKNPKTRQSRRIVMSAWNPCQINEMALPPCHVLVQFNVIQGNKLSCSLYQRSGDVGLGVPFNIASYSFLTHIIGHFCKLEPYEFIYYLGNCHIYDDHIESLKIQCKRIPIEFPTIDIDSKEYENINDYQVSDIKINDYNHHSTISMEMRK